MDNENKNGASTSGADFKELEELKNATHNSFVHANLDITFYTVKLEELELLENYSSSIHKDWTLACAGIGIPCLFNAIQAYFNFPLIKGSEESMITWDFVINLLGAVSCIFFALVEWYRWKKSANKSKQLTEAIKNRKQYKLK